MPIYEYQCTSCHHHFDLMQKVNDSPAHQCPKCFENTLVKLVSAAGFQLKGNGWYATDFKDKGKPAPAKSDDKADSPKETTPVKEKGSNAGSTDKKE